ncbi:uncharacterized protein CELE_F42D1.4 [Caenorhabditis elegans]|uniref:Transmembrane protein n=1 Tax=Caenorhabditis elegans TaxID=6239 RepID=Q564V8_CAEEL|nr:Transmembrane protein [Caenorhabditis elegans]CAI79249.1 Transmembrane protein [Caenorhabditis elegans]|eukprot:NP_001024656.1 Uncharacterized protein CELE_F42D1.4 [Caenorhabditis elegans]
MRHYSPDSASVVTVCAITPSFMAIAIRQVPILFIIVTDNLEKDFLNDKHGIGKRAFDRYDWAGVFEFGAPPWMHR